MAAGSQAAPEVTPTAPAALRPSGGAPEVTTPAPGSGTLPTSPPTRQCSRPTPSTAACQHLRPLLPRVQVRRRAQTLGFRVSSRLRSRRSRRWIALAGRGTAPGTRASAGKIRTTPGTHFGSHFIVRAPIFVARRCPTPSAIGPPTRGRRQNAWRLQLRRGRMSRLSVFRQVSSCGPCRRRPRAGDSRSTRRRATSRGSAGAS